jgi:hypothetical protein
MWWIHWNRHNHLWHHNGFDYSVSSWAVWGGHISNPTWQPRDRHCDDFELVINRNQPGPFQWSIWAKPNNLAYFMIVFSQFWSAKWAKANIWPFCFPGLGLFTTFLFIFVQFNLKLVLLVSWAPLFKLSHLSTRSHLSDNLTNWSHTSEKFKMPITNQK